MVAGAALLVIAPTALWLFMATRGQAGTSGADLGRLPFGTRRSDLNLVVVTLDTTRADRIGAYGYEGVSTPVFDRLAREGVLFEQATASAPITLPAHASIFTSKFPPEHGVRDNGGFFLAPSHVTLAEVLKDQGFRTGAFVAAYVLDGKWGLDQGFEEYADDFDLTKARGISLGGIQRPGNEVVDNALKWLGGVADERFFAWIHLYDPHTPYDPPEPFKTQYQGRPYVGEIAFTDAQVGRIVEFLEQRQLLERTVVAVLGDHGESLGDHGEGTHGFFIYQAVARVPFVVRAPFSATRGRRVADPIRSVDLMPTVLDLLGAPAPRGLEGRTLAPLMTGAGRELGLEAYAEALYPLHHFGWSALKALRQGRYKVIDAPRPELYDLDADPAEATNLFETRRSLGERMIARLREMEQRFSEPDAGDTEQDVDPEVRARLAALGYVGSFVARASDERSDLADPKDKIHLFNLMSDARELAKEDDRFSTVVEMLTRVTTEDPKVIDAWFMLGNEHFKAGRYEDAISYFKRTLDLKPDYDIAVINLANCYRMLGQDEAALAGYEHYLQIDPKNAYVRYQIGEIWLDRDELGKAEESFRQALEIDAKVAPARNALGVLAFKRGDLATAEREVLAAIELKPDVRLAHFNLALLAEERGNIALAKEEYRKELERHPTTYKAAYNLSRLYEREGQRALQIDALKQAIEANPRFAEGHFFLAKAHLDAGNVEEAVSIAKKGLEVDPKSEFAPLGHYVLADVYNRQGKAAEAAREVAAARALEARLGRTVPGP